MQIFASEVFPTNARASGFGFAHSGGRIGAAIIVPGFLFIQTTWGVPVVFGTIAVMLAVACGRGDADRLRDARPCPRRDRIADGMRGRVGTEP
jgi:uncharacterized membrane protein